jgi:hypothetical protein
MLGWRAGQVFGRDQKNKTIFVHLIRGDPLSAGSIQEECWSTIEGARIQKGWTWLPAQPVPIVIVIKKPPRATLRGSLS